jgi:hypothetical protein
MKTAEQKLMDVLNWVNSELRSETQEKMDRKYNARQILFLRRIKRKLEE